jgi:hypothetical protein
LLDLKTAGIAFLGLKYRRFWRRHRSPALVHNGAPENNVAAFCGQLSVLSLLVFSPG